MNNLHLYIYKVLKGTKNGIFICAFHIKISPIFASIAFKLQMNQKNCLTKSLLVCHHSCDIKNKPMQKHSIYDSLTIFGH